MLNRTLGSITAAALLMLGACGSQADPVDNRLDIQAQGSEQEQALEFLPVPGDLGLLNEIAAKAVGQVQLNSLATQRTNSPLVREYAQFMEQYSNNLLVRVENLATQKGAAVQAEMTLRDQFHYGRLENRYGTYFDDKYLSYQSIDADRSLSQIREGYEASIDPDVRSLTQDVVADLQDVAVLIQSVQTYRGSSQDQPGQFAVLLAQTKLGSAGDKGKAPGKTGDSKAPGPIPQQPPAPSSKAPPK